MSPECQMGPLHRTPSVPTSPKGYSPRLERPAPRSPILPHKCDNLAYMRFRTRNPFTPTFGFAPHVLIGRDGLLAASGHALEGGPGSSGFSALYMGPRGSGKTVLLNEIEDHAAQRGWTVISVDAASTGVGERISEMIEWAASGDDHSSDGSEQVTTVKGVRIGPFHARRETLRRVQPRWSLRRQLTELASAASQSGAGVLLSIDEMHRCESDSLLRLANDIQHVAKRGQMPLAFAGASLPEIKHTYLADDRFSFFRRCECVDLPLIDAADAFRFVTESVNAADGECTLEAARLLADACDGLPYQMQLLGDHAWRIAGAPDSGIDSDAAMESIRITASVMQDRVYRPTFSSLTPVERRYLAALAEHGGTATRRDLGNGSQLSAAQMATAEQWLMDNACIEIVNAHERPAGPEAEIGFGCALAASTVAERIEIESGYGQTGATVTHESARALSPRCNHPMPRARARCILRLGHRGGHRSR